MLRAFSRRAVALFAAMLSAGAVFALFDDARASRPAPDAEVAEAASQHADQYHRHQGEVTLGALIAIQRARRAERSTDTPLALASTSAVAGWQGQLGAFGTVDAAERERTEVTRATSLPLGLTVHYDGTLYRVRSIPAPGRGQADAFCRAVVRAGWACFVRRAEG